MAEQFDVPVEDFASVVEQFAHTVGDEQYTEEITDGFELTRRFIGRAGFGQSFVHFSALRHRPDVDGPVEYTEYTFSEGIRTYVGAFPEYVDNDLAELGAEYDSSDKLWLEERTTYAFTPGEPGGSSGVVVKNQELMYGSGEAEITSYALYDGKPLTAEPEDMEPPLDLYITAEHGGIALRELSPEIEVEPKPVESTDDLDSFDAIIAGMQSEMSMEARRVERIETVVRSMLSIIQTFPVISGDVA